MIGELLVNDWQIVSKSQSNTIECKALSLYLFLLLALYLFCLLYTILDIYGSCIHVDLVLSIIGTNNSSKWLLMKVYLTKVRRNIPIYMLYIQYLYRFHIRNIVCVVYLLLVILLQSLHSILDILLNSRYSRADAHRVTIFFSL